jgi:hypothetical protein
VGHSNFGQLATVERQCPDRREILKAREVFIGRIRWEVGPAVREGARGSDATW